MYQISEQQIPQNKRQEINDKIIYCIDNNIDKVSKEIIYNSYTGIGGLHDLKRDEFYSYSEYSDAKKEIEQGQFFTPHSICKDVVSVLSPSNTDMIADFCCGTGNFFNWLPEMNNVYGCELDKSAYKVAKHLYSNAHFENSDLLYYEPGVNFDLVIGNPPFNLYWNYKGTRYLSQHFYLIKAAELLKVGGICAIVVPKSFLEDEHNYKSILEDVNENFNFIFQSELSKNAFAQMGVNNYATKLLVLQKKSKFLENKVYTNVYSDFNIDALKTKQIGPIKDFLNKQKARLDSENLNSSNKKHSEGIKKFMYELKIHKHLKNSYTKALNLLYELEHQKKPENVSDKDWDDQKLTIEKVYFKLKGFVKNQYVKEVDKFCLVKHSYTYELKAYSDKFQSVLNNYMGQKRWNIAEMVAFNKNIDFVYFDCFVEVKKGIFNSLYKKRINFNLHNTPLDELSRNKTVDNFLSDFRFISGDDKEARFDEKQFNDLGITFQRDISLLNWQMGTGKTPSGYAWGIYNLIQKKSVKNIFIISGATAISTTWFDWMNLHKQNFYYVNDKTTKSDILNLQQYDWVLISTDYMKKFVRELKIFVKSQSYKVGLLFDESDELTNYYSKTTEFTLKIFKKCRNKFLTTGTTTRNNAGEIYGQLELLYNNSHNFICHCSTIYKETFVRVKDSLYREESGVKIRSYINENYNQPFPAYKGFALFKNCFNPSKKTVFGVNKDTQDIYNSEELNVLLGKTVLVRTFKEMAGEKYKIHQKTVIQNINEKHVYKAILKENQRIINQFFESTGNSRKDAALRIIRLIELLIKSTSTPNIFPDYNGNQMPGKSKEIVEMIKKWDNEQVAIGCTSHDAVNYYRNQFSSIFPFRQLFIITGKEPKEKRKIIIEDFKASFNGILLCTQQSLKNSVNIPSCNKVIVESLQWNIPRIEQWFFRFIRRNQKGFTNVYFITYENTIENNLLALLMSKEAINEMIKHREYKSNTDVMADYDLDESIIAGALSKAYDEEGNLYLTWGNQRVA